MPLPAPEWRAYVTEQHHRARRSKEADKTLSDSMHRRIQRGPVKIKSAEYRTLRTEIAENVIPASGNSSTTSCT